MPAPPFPRPQVRPNGSTKAYWTPATGAAVATLNAFTVVARDNELSTSSPAVQVKIEVLAPTGGIPTVGVYDEDEINTNTVNAVSAGSTLTLAETKTRSANAFAADTGGVWNFDIVVPGEWDSSPRSSFNLRYGVSQNNILGLTIAGGNVGQNSANPISGGFHGDGVEISGTTVSFIATSEDGLTTVTATATGTVPERLSIRLEVTGN